MAEQTSHHRIKLTGEMTCAFKGLLYEVDAASLKVLFDEDRKPYHLELHLNFTNPEQMLTLAEEMPGVKGHGPPYLLGFSMKESKIRTYSAAFEEVDALDQWVTVAGGACFELDNYDCIGPMEAL